MLVILKSKSKKGEGGDEAQPLQKCYLNLWTWIGSYFWNIRSSLGTVNTYKEISSS